MPVIGTDGTPIMMTTSRLLLAGRMRTLVAIPKLPSIGQTLYRRQGTSSLENADLDIQSTTLSEHIVEPSGTEYVSQEELFSVTCPNEVHHYSEDQSHSASKAVLSSLEADIAALQKLHQELSRSFAGTRPPDRFTCPTTTPPHTHTEHVPSPPPPPDVSEPPPPCHINHSEAWTQLIIRIASLLPPPPLRPGDRQWEEGDVGWHRDRMGWRRGGSVWVCGSGKSGIVGGRLASSLAALGVPAHFLHPSDAVHGNVGAVQPGDMVILMSVSGYTPELLSLAQPLRRRGASLVALTTNEKAPLARCILIGCDGSVANNRAVAPTPSSGISGSSCGDGSSISGSSSGGGACDNDSCGEGDEDGEYRYSNSSSSSSSSKNGCHPYHSVGPNDLLLLLPHAQDSMGGVVPSRSLLLQEAACNAVVDAVAATAGVRRSDVQANHPGGAIGLGGGGR